MVFQATFRTARFFSSSSVVIFDDSAWSSNPISLTGLAAHLFVFTPPNLPSWSGRCNAIAAVTAAPITESAPETQWKGRTMIDNLICEKVKVSEVMDSTTLKETRTHLCSFLFPKLSAVHS
jgi:hypothetical protein